MPAIRKKDTKKKKVQILQFHIDCSAPCEDNIFVPSAVENFLKSKIKVGGKTGKLGNQVAISTNGNIVKVTAHAPFSKRYLKYLTRKYLKAQQLRDWIRIVSTNKTTYTLKYFNIQDEDAEAKQ